MKTVNFRALPNEITFFSFTTFNYWLKVSMGLNKKKINGHDKWKKKYPCRFPTNLYENPQKKMTDWLALNYLARACAGTNTMTNMKLGLRMKKCIPLFEKNKTEKTGFVLCRGIRNSKCFFLQYRHIHFKHLLYNSKILPFLLKNAFFLKTI